MTVPSRQSINSPVGFTVGFTKTCLIFTLFMASVSILILAETTYKNQIQQEHEMSSKRVIDTSAIKAEEVQMTLSRHTGNDSKSLSYYHCGERFQENTITPEDTEIILLHGAKFTKENWMESNILQKLCLMGNDNPSENGRMSIVALDLSVRADYTGLLIAFKALSAEGVISGKPAVIVTPSASGKSITSLLPMDDKASKVAKSMLKVWMPVASPAVLGVKDVESFKSFKEMGIPILAMNGDHDEMGKKVTKKLVEFADAKGVQMKGGHPCYLDSPEYFVETVLAFLRDSEVVDSS